MDNKKYPSVIKSIVNRCVHLKQLSFSFKEAHSYSQELNHAHIKMPDIHKIHIPALGYDSSVRAIHLCLNYRFSSTITLLEMSDVGLKGAFEKYDVLIQYLRILQI